MLLAISHAHNFTSFVFTKVSYVYLGHAVVKLNEALRYRPKGRGVDSR